MNHTKLLWLSLSLSCTLRTACKIQYEAKAKELFPCSTHNGLQLMRPLTVTKILQQFRQYIPTASGHVKKAALAMLLAPSALACLLSKKTSVPQGLWWKYMQHYRASGRADCKACHIGVRTNVHIYVHTLVYRHAIVYVAFLMLRMTFNTNILW